MQIGRYTVLEELGRGGMASVFRAHDPSFGRDVAIKLISRELGSDAAFQARFEREAYVIAALEHVAIVPVYDFGQDDGRHYLVMRLLGGGSLRERLDRVPGMSHEEAIRVLGRLAEALDFAHERGVIHRDVKPQNVLFDSRGEPYLGDFGIARFSASATTLTGHSLIGTPAYMSPEQAYGNVPVTPASDVYCLGVVAYEMLCGRVPFKAENTLALMRMHIEAPPPPPRQFNVDLGGEAEEVLLRCLAKDPGSRYETASEFVTSLGVALGVIDRRFAQTHPRSPGAIRSDVAPTRQQLPVQPTPFLPTAISMTIGPARTSRRFGLGQAVSIYPVTLQNNGGEPAAVAISAANPLEECIVDVPEAVTIPPLSAVVTSISVRSKKRRWLGGSQGLTFSLVAAAPGNQPTAATARFVDPGGDALRVAGAAVAAAGIFFAAALVPLAMQGGGNSDTARPDDDEPPLTRQSPTVGSGGSVPTPVPTRGTPPASDATPAPAPARYIVQAGDTCFSISIRFFVTIEELESLNPDLDCDALEPGQELRIR